MATYKTLSDLARRKYMESDQIVQDSHGWMAKVHWSKIKDKSMK